MLRILSNGFEQSIRMIDGWAAMSRERAKHVAQDRHHLV